MCSSGSSKVVMAAGSQGLFCFLLIQAWALQQPVQSSEQQEKKYPLGHWTAFTLPGFSPSQADQFFFPTPPSHPFPHRNSLSPPQISLQLSYRQIYLSNFKNFGSKKTLGQLSWGKVGMLVLHIAVDRAHPSKVLALYIKSQSNTIH